MSDPLPGVTAARLPAAGVAALAAVRDVPGVRLHPAGGRVWVTWPSDRGRVARRLLGVFGAEFFARRGDAWFRFAARVPTSDAPPPGEGVPLAGALVPGRFAATPPPAAGPTIAVTLERGGPPRSTSALLCPVAALAAWADVAPTDELTAARVAVAGGRALLLGGRLPTVADAVRFWGETLLVPLGFRPSPELSPALLREAAGAAVDELMLLTADGCELVPRGAFAPATRTGLRLAGAR